MGDCKRSKEKEWRKDLEMDGKGKEEGWRKDECLKEWREGLRKWGIILKDNWKGWKKNGMDGNGKI